MAHAEQNENNEEKGEIGPIRNKGKRKGGRKKRKDPIILPEPDGRAPFNKGNKVVARINDVEYPGTILKRHGGNANRQYDVLIDQPVADPRPRNGPSTPSRVSATWHHHINAQLTMCQINGITLTPDHPVLHNGQWTRPENIVEPRDMYIDTVYNFAVDGFRAAVFRGEGDQEVVACTLGMEVPGLEDPVWGTEKVVEMMKGFGGFPAVVTSVA